MDDDGIAAAYGHFVHADPERIRDAPEHAGMEDELLQLHSRKPRKNNNLIEPSFIKFHVVSPHRGYARRKAVRLGFVSNL